MEEKRDLIEEQSGLTIHDLFIIVRKNLFWFIVTPIICAILAFIYGKVAVVPMYSSTARLYVVSASDSIIDIGDLQLGASLTNDYIELIKGKPFVEEALEKIENTDYTYSEVQNMISIINPTDSHILRISITAPDATFAADLANALSEVSVTQIADIMETSRPKIVEYAEPNYSKVSPRLTVYVMTGVLIGLVLCSLVVLILNLCDQKIKTEEDVEKYLGLDTLGFIADKDVEKTKKQGKNAKN